jgi:hypothetical protein
MYFPRNRVENYVIKTLLEYNSTVVCLVLDKAPTFRLQSQAGGAQDTRQLRISRPRVDSTSMWVGSIKTMNISIAHDSLHMYKILVSDLYVWSLGFSRTAFFGMGWHGLRLH